MTRTWFEAPRIGVMALFLAVCWSSPALAQRADRAIISGVVTDTQGAAVPGATVTVRNERDWCRDRHHHEHLRRVHHAAAGAGPLFGDGRSQQDRREGRNIGDLLQGGEAVRHDVAMQVGTLEETVIVTSRGGIDVTTPDVAHTVNENRPPPADHYRR